MTSKAERFRRLLDPRVRSVILVLATVLFLAGAVVIGLPPQSRVPKALGQMIVLPDLPSDASASSRQVGLGWLALPGENRQWAAMVWATSDVDLYAAVDDTSGVAEVLRQCVAKPEPSRPGPVAGNPGGPVAKAAQAAARGVRQAGLGRSAFAHLLQARPQRHAGRRVPEGSCSVDTAYSLTMDAVELHIRAPEITVVMPKAVVTGGEPEVRTIVSLGALPPGWSVQDQRAAFGKRQEGTDNIGWDGAQVAKRQFGEPWNVGVVALGPATVEASSLNEARRAERALFWAGLLVGLAGSCLLMLFAGLPWRTGGQHDRASVTASAEDPDG